MIAYLTLIQVNEFQRCIDITDAQTCDNNVFVIWDRKWLAESESSDEESIFVEPETSYVSSKESESEKSAKSESDSMTSDREEEIQASIHIGQETIATHTVTFKCIGSTKELQYQEILGQVNHMIGKYDW